MMMVTMMAHSTTGLPFSDHNCVSMGLATTDQSHAAIIVIIIVVAIVSITIIIAIHGAREWLTFQLSRVDL